jgi:ATP-dependent 26S proteasome regulatory subunit
VLTTNRAGVLETALADRPGRVDLAVEIPRPDLRCRERLIRVYARDLTVEADLARVAGDTEDITASFIKELIRRTVLASLRAGDSPPVLRDSYFADVLAEMNGERHALTRSLLGAGQGPAEHPAPRPARRRGPENRPSVYLPNGP